MRKARNFLYALVLIQSFFLYAEPKLHVCTVAPKETKGLHQLLDSCERYDIAITVLGMDQPLNGQSHKLIYVEDFLQNLNDKDIVLYVNSEDTLFLSSSEKIRNIFLEMQVPFVISSERFCWPHFNLEPEYPRGPTSFRYIHSGSFIGYVEHLKRVLSEIDAPFFKNDQGLFTDHYFKNPDLYTLDATCVLFLPLAGVIQEELKIDPALRSVSCTETGIKTCLIHGNGGSRPMYQEVYNRFYH